MKTSGERISLDAGSGGAASQRLIAGLFHKHFDNPILGGMNDAALLSIPPGKVAMSTDSYTVSPLFFPGGSIGDLAINGTVNDVAMLGARPLYLSCGFIIEEGFPMPELEKIVLDMANACKNAAVDIVTGDTKVVPYGKCDGVFINTTGIGHVYADPVPMGNAAKPGDAVLLSGTVGDHGFAVMASRLDETLAEEARTDSAPLAKMLEAVIKGAGPVHVLRDPTRGGLATTLNEIAAQSSVAIEIEENLVPVNLAVADGCSILGLDPLYLANEGKCIVILPEPQAKKALEIMRSFPCGNEARQIGVVKSGKSGRVTLRTLIGGSRMLNMLEGAQMPRIC